METKQKKRNTFILFLISFSFIVFFDTLYSHNNNVAFAESFSNMASTLENCNTINEKRINILISSLDNYNSFPPSTIELLRQLVYPIPVELIEHNKEQIKKLDQYTLNESQVSSEESSYVNSTTIYVFSEDKQLLVTNKPFECINYLIQKNIIKRSDLETTAIEWLIKHYDVDASQTSIFYFSMHGCKDCQQAEAILSNYVEQLSNVNFIKINRYNDLAYAPDIDYGSLFQAAFEIDWYPTFLIIDQGEHRFIRKTDINRLPERLFGEIHQEEG